MRIILIFKINFPIMNVNVWIDYASEIVQILEVILASENVMNLKIRKYHWNVEGVHFYDYHKFFEELYNESSDSIDEIAERIRALWLHTIASFSEYLKLSVIAEDMDSYGTDRKMLTRLLEDKETMIKLLRESITKVWELADVGTEDFLTGLIQKHEKNAWILRSMLK